MMRAAGVSFADVQIRMVLYPEAPRLPFVPGYEVAGVVTEIGPRVGSLRPGDRVLIPGAAGGVGMAAVQIAARVGGSVVGLVGSPAKREAVLSLGAREVFTYEEWAGRGGAGSPGRRGGRTRTAAREFDVIIDPRGGAALRDSIGRLAEAGRVVSCGVSDMVRGPRRSITRSLATLLRTPILNPIGLGMRNQGVFGMNVLRLFNTESGMRIAARAMDAVLEVFRQREFRVIVGGKWPLARAGDAHAFLQSRMSVGKVVLV
ncbi:MAG: zinc-binding dehydrogenase [Spirochaetes bacterium]|nr:zinc-binding dehydrogenase [Spirochaetota bacterium]